MSRLAEPDEGFEGEAVGIDGHGDVDLAAAGRHLDGDAGESSRTGLFHRSTSFAEATRAGLRLRHKVDYSSLRESLKEREAWGGTLPEGAAVAAPSGAFAFSGFRLA